MIPVVIPGTFSRAEDVPAAIAVKSEGIELSGRPAFSAAGITLAGRVVFNRFESMVTYIVARMSLATDR